MLLRAATEAIVWVASTEPPLSALATCLLRASSEAPIAVVALLALNRQSPLDPGMLVVLAALAAVAVLLAQHKLRRPRAA